MVNYLEIGKRISFVQLLEDNKINIPLIQRDYVQGRTDENEVRIEFLNAIHTYLKENKPFRDLDFVYGFLDENNVLYPLDGQQRLTTLMLLHWFLANKEEEKFDKYKELCLIDKDGILRSKFSYENRVSSKEFCNKLFSLRLDIKKAIYDKNNKSIKLSEVIKNFNWYASVWDFDPTVQNMLNMLDAMSSLFINEENFFDRLINKDEPIITFLFMDLGKNNLSDDLYIKMNSRGVQLTPFENFKAKLESFISKEEITKNYIIKIENSNKIVDFKTYYSNSLDSDWSNMIWQTLIEHDKNIEHPELFDVIWTNVYRISFLHSLLNTDFEDKIITPAIQKFLTHKKQFSFYDYSTLFLNEVGNKIVPLNKESVKEFVELLDLLKDNLKIFDVDEFSYYIPRQSFYKLITADYKTAQYQERLMFFAFTEFLKSHGGEYHKNNLKDWMRFISNLTNSTSPYNNIQEFLNSIKFIKTIVEFSSDIDNYLANQNFNDIIGFDSIQYREEILKRKLETADLNWKNIFKEAELHPYLQGQTNFLLMLTGIDEIGIEDVLLVNQLKLQEKYKEYFSVFINIFPNKGLNMQFSKDGDYIFERALLSLGDYSISEGQNKSFLIDNDRDISWKRFLKLDKNINHKEIIKKLFNMILEDELDTKNGLLNIINRHKDCNVWWRYLIINNEKILSYYDTHKKRYFREFSNHGFVLLRGERVSGSHAELESYNFYLNNQDKWDYYSVSGENNQDIPCAYMDFKVEENIYGIDIRFINNQFNIAVKKRSLEQPYSQKIEQFLILNSFERTGYFSKSVGNYENLENFLEVFLEDINKI